MHMQLEMTENQVYLPPPNIWLSDDFVSAADDQYTLHSQSLWVRMEGSYISTGVCFPESSDKQ